MGTPKWAAVVAAGLLLTACAGDDSTPAEDPTPAAAPEDVAEEPAEESAYSEACGQTVQNAAAIDEMQDTVEDLDPAISACADLAAFQAATDDHPDALDGADAETFATNRCLYSEDGSVTASAICAEVGE